jgi:hypothetical protein
MVFSKGAIHVAEREWYFASKFMGKIRINVIFSLRARPVNYKRGGTLLSNWKFRHSSLMHYSSHIFRVRFRGLNII